MVQPSWFLTGSQIQQACTFIDEHVSIPPARDSVKAFIYSKINYIMIPSHGMLCPPYMAEISPPEVRGSNNSPSCWVIGLGKSFLYLLIFLLIFNVVNV